MGSVAFQGTACADPECGAYYAGDSKLCPLHPTMPPWPPPCCARDRLDEIADALGELPGGMRSVSLGVSDEAFRLLCSLGGKAHTTLYGGTDRYAIDAAYLAREGVDFSAQCPKRPLTDEEGAELDERGHVHSALITARVPR